MLGRCLALRENRTKVPPSFVQPVSQSQGFLKAGTTKCKPSGHVLIVLLLTAEVNHMQEKGKQTR